MKSKYDLDLSDSMKKLYLRLCQSRREKRVYVTSNILQLIQCKVCLRENEIQELEEFLRRARYGKELPLAPWLPRGYQIARLLVQLQFAYPRKVIRPTQRDIRLIREAAKHYVEDRNDRRNSSRQLSSLKDCCRHLKIIL